LTIETVIESMVGVKPNFIKSRSIRKIIWRFSDHKIMHDNQDFSYKISKNFFIEFDVRKSNYDLKVKFRIAFFKLVN
jgi:hypothetical protein